MRDKKPIVFVSSTIHDFKDLRSAIKYYLEELGYEVWLSEYNDFPNPLEQNVYEACLSTIERTDFFILLIGSRVGGYYDLNNKISITQMEYQKAYQLARSGKLKCVFFVRDDLWKIKEDRTALEDYLAHNFVKEHDLNSEDQAKIVNHSSSYANDADFIFKFINEVSRHDEMQYATANGTPFPAVNWIHTFTSFRDVVDVLRTNLNISENLSTAVLKINLIHELKENLSVLSEKHKGQIGPKYIWASSTRRHIASDLNGSSTIPGPYLQMAVVFSVTGVPVYGLSTQFIDQALMSGYFLEYNKGTGNFIPTPISESLFELKQRIDHLQVMSRNSQEPLFQFAMKYKEVAKTKRNVVVSNVDLVLPLAIADTQQDIFTLSIGILKALDNDHLLIRSLKLNPPSPFVIDAEKIKQETVTAAEINKWVDEQVKKLYSTVQNQMLNKNIDGQE